MVKHNHLSSPRPTKTTDAAAEKHAQSPLSYSSGALRTKVTSQMTNMTFCVVTPALCADVYETQTLEAFHRICGLVFSPSFPQLAPVILRENKYQLCPSSASRAKREHATPLPRGRNAAPTGNLTLGAKTRTSADATSEQIRTTSPEHLFTF